MFESIGEHLSANSTPGKSPSDYLTNSSPSPSWPSESLVSSSCLDLHHPPCDDEKSCSPPFAHCAKMAFQPSGALLVGQEDNACLLRPFPLRIVDETEKNTLFHAQLVSGSHTVFERDYSGRGGAGSSLLTGSVEQSSKTILFLLLRLAATQEALGAHGSPLYALHEMASLWMLIDTLLFANALSGYRLLRCLAHWLRFQFDDECLVRRVLSMLRYGVTRAFGVDWDTALFRTVLHGNFDLAVMLLECHPQFDAHSELPEMVRFLRSSPLFEWSGSAAAVRLPTDESASSNNSSTAANMREWQSEALGLFKSRSYFDKYPALHYSLGISSGALFGDSLAQCSAGHEWYELFVATLLYNLPALSAKTAHELSAFDLRNCLLRFRQRHWNPSWFDSHEDAADLRPNSRREERAPFFRILAANLFLRHPAVVVEQIGNSFHDCRWFALHLAHLCSKVDASSHLHMPVETVLALRFQYGQGLLSIAADDNARRLVGGEGTGLEYIRIGLSHLFASGETGRSAALVYLDRMPPPTPNCLRELLAFVERLCDEDSRRRIGGSERRSAARRTRRNSRYLSVAQSVLHLKIAESRLQDSRDLARLAAADDNIFDVALPDAATTAIPVPCRPLSASETGHAAADRNKATADMVRCACLAVGHYAKLALRLTKQALPPVTRDFPVLRDILHRLDAHLPLMERYETKSFPCRVRAFKVMVDLKCDYGEASGDAPSLHTSPTRGHGSIPHERMRRLYRSLVDCIDAASTNETLPVVCDFLTFFAWRLDATNFDSDDCRLIDDCIERKFPSQSTTSRSSSSSSQSLSPLRSHHGSERLDTEALASALPHGVTNQQRRQRNVPLSPPGLMPSAYQQLRSAINERLRRFRYSSPCRLENDVTVGARRSGHAHCKKSEKLRRKSEKLARRQQRVTANVDECVTTVARPPLSKSSSARIGAVAAATSFTTARSASGNWRSRGHRGRGTRGRPTRRVTTKLSSPNSAAVIGAQPLAKCFVAPPMALCSLPNAPISLEGRTVLLSFRQWPALSDAVVPWRRPLSDGFSSESC